MVGVDVSAASSASPQAVLLALGVFDLPLGGFSTTDMSPKSSKTPLFWLSGELGLKGMAQPGNLSGAASAGYYATAVNATPDKIVQSLDVSMHFGWQLHSWTIPANTFDSGTISGTPNTAATLSLIVGGGAITPLSNTQTNAQVYEATPLIQQLSPVSPASTFASSCSANPTAAPTCYVVFLPSDRTHFYRNYNAGFRLKLYGVDHTDQQLRFPAILDFTVGQNEYVTGGSMHGAVLHVGGSFPIPGIDSFYVFGSMDLGLSFNNGGGPQLQLIPAPATAGVTVTSPTVYTISTSQPNRDRYQIGFGIDVFHLFASYIKKLQMPSTP
jgi:hypothetical protein